MGVIDLNYKMSEVQGSYRHLALSDSEFKRFNPDVLGLKNISNESQHIDALAAIFDLKGFTSFCNQIDPQLVVPQYTGQFLDWLFKEIAKNFAKEKAKGGVILWGKFPFFAKFLGDGIMFLWDTGTLGHSSLGNIVVNLYKVCKAYENDFLPKAKKEFAQVPTQLRCGVARGQIIEIGGGQDFVGPCINMASRLQKISQLSFAFPRKGFDPKQCFSKTWFDQFILKVISVRGIGSDEHVFVCREEYEELSDDDKELFRDG